MSLLEICQAIEQTTISSIVRESAFPYVEGAHVLGLSLSVGTVMWFDLRLIGATMRSRAVSDVFQDLKPWMFAGFAIMFLTGGLLFFAHATKAYGSGYFRAKLALLMLAQIRAAKVAAARIAALPVSVRTNCLSGVSRRCDQAVLPPSSVASGMPPSPAARVPSCCSASVSSRGSAWDSVMPQLSLAIPGQTEPGSVLAGGSPPCRVRRSPASLTLPCQLD